MSLRALALGEIIDRSATFWRRHWLALFRLFLPFELLQYLLLKLWQLALPRLVPGTSVGSNLSDLIPAIAALTQGSGQHAAAPPPADLALIAGSTGVVLAMVMVTTMVLGVAASAWASPRLLESGSPSLLDALRTSARRLLVTVASLGLSAGWTLAVGVACQLPTVGCLAGLLWASRESRPAMVAPLALAALFFALAGALLASVWFVIRFALIAQVLGLERGGPVAVFRRTGELSSGRVEPGVLGWVKLRLAILLTVVMAILMIVTLASGLPQLALALAFGGPLSSTGVSAVPPWLLVPSELLQSVVQALVSPIYVVFLVVFYLDLRVRREGLDLELRLPLGHSLPAAPKEPA